MQHILNRVCSLLHVGPPAVQLDVGIKPQSSWDGVQRMCVKPVATLMRQKCCIALGVAASGTCIDTCQIAYLRMHEVSRGCSTNDDVVT
jgi:hypothetical protein